jgi:hypothetical protein
MRNGEVLYNNLHLPVLNGTKVNNISLKSQTLLYFLKTWMKMWTSIELGEILKGILDYFQTVFWSLKEKDMIRWKIL